MKNTKKFKAEIERMLRYEVSDSNIIANKIYSIVKKYFDIKGKEKKVKVVDPYNEATAKSVLHRKHQWRDSNDN